MADEGGGSTSGSGGESGTGSAGGGDIGDILAYLRHRSFGVDGDYTGSGGYGGDNTGPVGSREPEKDEDGAVALLDALTAVPGQTFGLTSRRVGEGDLWRVIEPYTGSKTPVGSLFAFVGQDVDPYSGVALGSESPDPFTGTQVMDPFTASGPPARAGRAGSFAAIRRNSLLSSPNLLASNGPIVSENLQPKVAPDVMDEIRRLAGEARDGPVLVIENGEVRTVTYVRNTIITSAEALGREPQSAPPPQTPPPEPDHRFGFYPMKQAMEQADRDTSRFWALSQYGQAAISYGITKFLGVFAAAEQLMPYNVPDHFLSAGQYAKRWIWYDMRGHSGKGLLELGKGHLEAADIVGSVDLLASGVKMIGSSGLTLETTAQGSLAGEAPEAVKGFDPSTLNEEAASIQKSIDPHLRGWKGAPVANATTIGVSGGMTPLGQEIKIVTASNPDAWDLLYFEIVPLPKGMRLGPPPLLTGRKLHWSSHVEVSGAAEVLRLGADWVWTGTSRPACWGSCAPLFLQGLVPMTTHVNIKW